MCYVCSSKVYYYYLFCLLGFLQTFPYSSYLFQYTFAFFLLCRHCKELYCKGVSIFCLPFCSLPFRCWISSVLVKYLLLWSYLPYCIAEHIRNIRRLRRFLFPFHIFLVVFQEMLTRIGSWMCIEPEPFTSYNNSSGLLRW